MYKDVYKWIRIEKYKRFESSGYMAILTPVIFRQNASSDVLQPLVILSIQIFSTAQYSIGFRNTWSKVLWWTMSGWRIRLSVLLSSNASAICAPACAVFICRWFAPCWLSANCIAIKVKMLFYSPQNTLFIRLFYFFNRWRKKLTINFTNNQTAIKINLFI